MGATQRDVSRNNRSLTSPRNPPTDRLKQAKSRLFSKRAEPEVITELASMNKAEQIFPCKRTKLGLEGMLALCERRDEKPSLLTTSKVLILPGSRTCHYMPERGNVSRRCWKEVIVDEISSYEE